MRPRNHVILTTGSTVVILDQLAKAAIRAQVPLNTRIQLIDDVFALTHVQNRGMAFGIFNGIDSPWLRWLLVGVAVVAVTVIWAYARQGTHRLAVALAFGAILGGAVGNLIDRIRFGHVVDFLLAHWGSYQWPAFNVADTAITMGGLGLFLILAREPHPGGHSDAAASDDEESEIGAANEGDEAASGPSRA